MFVCGAINSEKFAKKISAIFFAVISINLEPTCAIFPPTLAVDINGSKVTTIEGLVKNGKMHPMQEAFKKMHGLQCGFCTPGMVMSAIDLLQNKKNPSDTEIREWLEGNICRCTGYQNIVAAVKEAASKM